MSFAAHRGVILPFVYSYWHEAIGVCRGLLAEKTGPDENSAGGNWPQRTEVSLFLFWKAAVTLSLVSC